jgi:RNA polymerase sigma-70 factor (ECF subfamily)
MRDHYPSVYRFVRRRTRSAADAEDITQDVFEAASRALADTAEDVSPPLAWLYTVAKRRLVDQHRRTSQRPSVESLDARDVVSDDGPAYADGIVADLIEALSELPSSQRQVLVLKLVRGWRFAEIGESLGIGEDAAKMRFARGLKQLRSALEVRGVQP